MAEISLTLNRGSGMIRRLAVIGNITRGLGILSVLLLIYMFGAFEYFRPRLLLSGTMVQQGEALIFLIYIGLLVSFVFHLAALLTTVLQMQVFGVEGVYRKVVLVYGIISFMSLFGEVGALDDIWNRQWV